MREPVIGVVDLGSDPFRRYMKNKYLAALRAAGAQPLLLGWAAGPQAAEAAMARCSGLLLPGGADLAPALYGQSPRPKCGKPCPGRDTAEPLLFAAARAQGKPVLGICRGCQLLNAVLGGTLYQDLSELPAAHLRHMDFFGRAKHVHTVTLAPGSRLAACRQQGAGVQGVNSMHHQALHTAAPGLAVAALSEDGVIEALEASAGPFCVGVQWHPEHLFHRDPFALAIFRAFVQAAQLVPAP